MKTYALITLFGSCLFIVASVLAGERQEPMPDLPILTHHADLIYGGDATAGKAVVDTIDLMGPTGSGAPYLGDFEAGWNGWTSVDLTEATVSHWQVSDYQQTVPGNLAAWCGSLAYPSCGDGDLAGGYGNDWYDALELRLPVGDPQQSATVRVTATLQNDTEPFYDFTYLSATLEGQVGYTDLQAWDGQGIFAVDDTFTYLPGELVGGEEVVISFRVVTELAYSDEDCLFSSAGACLLDDITVTVSQAGQEDIVHTTDFQDGTFGDWQSIIPPGVGDFAALWTGLQEVDPCVSNFSQQVAFVDDGVVVPGTGGSECINWCYGPNGYIVTTTGGLAGPDFHIRNSILSPVMAWPDGDYDGLRLDFGVFHQEDFTFDSPGTFYIWGVRSADTDNSAGNGAQVITEQPFRDRGRIEISGPEYVRVSQLVSDLLAPGRDEVQVQLGVYELGWAFEGGSAWIGDDGYPAPYFDNVAVKAYPAGGPALIAQPEDLAQDNFPEIDELDFEDLGALHVRFDAARNIAPRDHLRNDPGDSLVVEIKALRAGASLVGTPELHYLIDANPAFDDFRTTATSGIGFGQRVFTSSGALVADQWAFDLPDTGTLFPGDVLHYYFQASDVAAGEVRTSTLPADLSGYGAFAEPLTYDPRFVVHALPSIIDYWGDYRVAPILIWDDSGDLERATGIYEDLLALGSLRGRDFDFYRTSAADLGVGNGLGGRTDGSSLAWYEAIVYSAGSAISATLSSGDFYNDPGDDIGALEAWLAPGDKGLFLCGDGLAADLVDGQGVDGIAFLEGIMGLDLVTYDLRTYIGNQVSPLVVTGPGPHSWLFRNASRWLVDGGCPRINTFDGVEAVGAAERLAEFTDPNQNPGAYSFSAVTYNQVNDHRIISMPYDLRLITDPEGPAGPREPGLPALVLGDILSFISDWTFPPPPPGVPVAEVFSLACVPNPFNPATRLDYTIKGPGHLSLKIYNLRGELVRTLIDGQVRASGHVMWDGTDQAGAQVSSGVYFSEARMGDEKKINKMALIK